MKPSLKSVASAPGLELPCATIKARPEDWRVNESLGWAFTKSGEHRYLYIEKRNMNTAAGCGRVGAALLGAASGRWLRGS
jgi:tRNA(Glu) U13 pseudouridine synthase TruD